MILVTQVANQDFAIEHPRYRPHREYRDDLPMELVEAYNEAGACLGAGANAASMVMSRRALQRLLKEQGHTQRNLKDGIDKAKEAGTIRPQFHGLADEIREYENLGAHPDDDQLANANAENARYIIDFCDFLIADIYDLRARAESLRKQRTGEDVSPGAIHPHPLRGHYAPVLTPDARPALGTALCSAARAVSVELRWSVLGRELL